MTRANVSVYLKHRRQIPTAVAHWRFTVADLDTLVAELSRWGMWTTAHEAIRRELDRAAGPTAISPDFLLSPTNPRKTTNKNELMKSKPPGIASSQGDC